MSPENDTNIAPMHTITATTASIRMRSILSIAAMSIVHRGVVYCTRVVSFGPKFFAA